MSAGNVTERRSRRRKDQPSVDAQRFLKGAFDEADQAAYEATFAVEGLDQEIAALRTKVLIAATDPEKLALMVRGVEVLSHLLGKRYALPSASVAELAEAMRASLEDIARPNPHPGPLPLLKGQATDGALPEAAHD